MSRALSLPHEHGGYLTIAGAAASGVALAHARGPALAVAAVTAAAFFARAPVEQLARNKGARLDGALVVALGAVVFGGALALGSGWAALALVVAAAIVCGSLVARRGRWQRAAWFETLGMAALGGSAGLIAVAGGADLGTGAALAIVVGVHTGLAVPLVRAEVRPRERGLARRAGGIALAVVAAAATVLALAGLGRFALALAPRALHALSRATWPASPSRPTVVGLRESAMLAAVVSLVILAAAR
ncbi:MAG TPA: YwiC-like family protein [Polyangia bacterium]